MHRNLVEDHTSPPPRRAIFTPKKALSKNNRYYSVVDRHSNITLGIVTSTSLGFINEHYQTYQAILVHIAISQLYKLKLGVTIY